MRLCVVAAVLFQAQVAFAAQDLDAQGAIAARDFDLWHGMYRISAESAKLPDGEHIGLAGINYLIDVAPWLYSGVGAYGAMTGKHGGFLVGGIAAGVLFPLTSDLGLDAGAFVGGGGGKAALVGGGLMVRSHAGLVYDAGTFRVGLQYVNLDFPNGAIRNNHAAITFDIPFTTLRLRSGLAWSPSDILVLDEVIRATDRAPLEVRDFLGPLFAVYHPFSGVKNTDGVTPTESISLIGFGYGRFISERGYLFMETAGAFGGDADGYAEFFFGGGYRLPLLSSGDRLEAGDLFLDGRFSVGSGGGGKVDTGGGGLSKGEIGLRYSLTDRLQIGVSGGIVDAFRGEFRATGFSADVSYGLDFISYDRPGLPSEPPLRDVQVLDWRVRFSNQVYLTEDEKMRSIRSGGLVSLLGVKADADVTRNIYLSGQALGAYTGGAGGYAVGLIGPGLRSDGLFGSNVRIFAEALAGAGGGGGINVGGGALIQAAAGVVYDLGDWISIEASCGKVKALHGQLDTAFYDVGLVYRFSTLNRINVHD